MIYHFVKLKDHSFGSGWDDNDYVGYNHTLMVYEIPPTDNCIYLIQNNGKLHSGTAKENIYFHHIFIEIPEIS